MHAVMVTINSDDPVWVESDRHKVLCVGRSRCRRASIAGNPAEKIGTSTCNADDGGS